ncbi:miraculin-like [Silene latifolia]|uniref:miraculin-like n=1 Tax=Silene latifolia TaxID=37657 RepID=UPI003D781B17
MSSLLYQASITTLFLLSFLSFSIADDNHILDIRNDPIINGGDYYIVPAIGDYEGYLSYNPKNDLCPLYVKNTYNPTAVKISISGNSQFINLNQRVSIAFNGSNPCNESLVWRRTLKPLARREYITTGGVEGDLSFSITLRNKSRPPFYVLKYWPSSSEVGSLNVGLYYDEDDEPLGLTKSPITVFFEKTSRNNPRVSTA